MMMRFPLYKRIPERALHGIVTFFAGLLVFCGCDTNGLQENPDTTATCSHQLKPQDSKEPCGTYW
jgi:hypothetical protein